MFVQVGLAMIAEQVKLSVLDVCLGGVILL